MKRTVYATFGAAAAAVGMLMVSPLTASAHCDTMEGPVVGDAQKALEENNSNYISRWGFAEDEGEVLAIFNQVMEVRDDSPEAQKLADQYLFENLVRIHRAGEGAPYTGVKPEETEIAKEVAGADASIAVGNLDPLKGIVSDEKITELEESFEEVMATKEFDENNVEAGREYVEAYVTFTHLAEEEGHAAEEAVHGSETEVHDSTEGTENESADIKTASSGWASWALAGLFFITTIIGFTKKGKNA